MARLTPDNTWLTPAAEDAADARAADGWTYSNPGGAAYDKETLQRDA